MKPDNILLQYDVKKKAFIPKIIDFGLAEKEENAKVLEFLSEIIIIIYLDVLRDKGLCCRRNFYLLIIYKES